MIVTIDGPAGAGKSSVARLLAGRIGFRFLDTGAMYRAVALAGLRRGVDWERPEELAGLARQLDIRWDGTRLRLDGEDVSAAIRTPELTALVRHAAGNRGVREHLVGLQRQAAMGVDIVTEGRDQGTLVFPDAQCKIFLTASPAERARRRVAELQARGQTASLAEVLAQQTRRDREDEGRDWGRLAKAADAVDVVTDGLTVEQVVDGLERIVRQRQTT
jgi:cytidylate kinase/pantoate ligase/cytidylate kinase